jgi:hypothetical protein
MTGTSTCLKDPGVDASSIVTNAQKNLFRGDDYNALQLKFQRRLSRGLQALTSYSWSHSIDIASTDAIATNVNTPGQIADANVDRGNSNFDIRHAFTAGVTYQLPALLSGWSIDSFFFARWLCPKSGFWHVFSMRSAPEEHHVYSLTKPIPVRSSGALCVLDVQVTFRS